MFVGRTVKLDAVAILPIARQGPLLSALPTASALDLRFGPPLTLGHSGNLHSGISLANLIALAAGPTPATDAIPIFEWQRLDRAVPVGTAYVPLRDSGMLTGTKLDRIIASVNGDFKPVMPSATSVAATPKTGDFHIKNILEAGAGFGLTRAAYKTIYFSNTVPPDQLTTLLQNYGALTPDAATKCASTLLSVISSSGGHAALYGLAATGAGIVVLQVTHKKVTLPQTLKWSICFFAAGVFAYIGMRYLGWVN